MEIVRVKKHETLAAGIDNKSLPAFSVFLFVLFFFLPLHICVYNCLNVCFFALFF